jgi:hypothetical protein
MLDILPIYRKDFLLIIQERFYQLDTEDHLRLFIMKLLGKKVMHCEEKNI